MQDVSNFDGSNPDWVHAEAAAWLKVMHELRALMPDIEAHRRPIARRLIGQAETALHPCTSERVGFADQIVDDARESVQAVLTVFPEHVEFVKSVLFLTLATSRLGALVDRAEAMNVKSLPEDQRKRISQALESVSDTFAAKLDELETQLDESDSAQSERPRDV